MGLSLPLLCGLPESKEPALFITDSHGSRTAPNTYWAQPSEEMEVRMTPHQTPTGPERLEVTPHSPHLFLA